MFDFKGVIKNYSKNMLNTQFSRRTTYTKYFLKTKVKDNVIFYESFHGKAMNDNPLPFSNIWWNLISINTIFMFGH